jgi:hypothetical protein
MSKTRFKMSALSAKTIRLDFVVLEAGWQDDGLERCWTTGCTAPSIRIVACNTKYFSFRTRFCAYSTLAANGVHLAIKHHLHTSYSVPPWTDCQILLFLNTNAYPRLPITKRRRGCRSTRTMSHLVDDQRNGNAIATVIHTKHLTYAEFFPNPLNTFYPYHVKSHAKSSTENDKP